MSEAPYSRTTSSFTVSRDAAGIIIVRTQQNAMLNANNTAEAVMAHVEAAAGIKRPLLVDTRQIHSQDRQSRRLASGPEISAVTSRAALVVGNPVSRVIANFFMRITSPSYPVRVFDDEAKARAWLVHGAGA